MPADAATHLPFAWRVAPPDVCEPCGLIDKHGHIGFTRSASRAGSISAWFCPVGRLEATQLRGLAEITKRYGSGTLRLTVWQNLLISDIAEASLGGVEAAVRALGLHTSASAIRGGLVACAGNAGCKFALSDTKRHSMMLVDHLESRLTLDQPINIHLTGCRELCRSVPAEQVPEHIEALLRGYLAERHPSESFHAISRRRRIEDLARLCNASSAT